MKSEAVAKHRAAILRPLLELEKKGDPIGRAIGDAAWELGLSKSYTWKLYRRLKENDARSVALQPGRRGPKPGKGRLAPDVERIISTTLSRYYLVRERSSFLRIWREIRSECDAKGFQPPTRRTVKRRLDAMDQRKVISKRHGADVAGQLFAARPGKLDVPDPLDVVQIDHTKADVFLVDHIDRQPLARPNLTMAIDVTTRVVLGVYVSFDAPSVLSVALCLDHCGRRKTVHVPGTLEELTWPTAGIPKAVHVDNAQEFRSRAFKSACEDWGIDVSYRPKGGKHYGGHIERLIGTTMGSVHVLPGTTHSSPKDKGDYNSEQNATLTLAEFEDWLHLEICRYHNTPHRALGRTPLAAWSDLGGDTAGRQVVDVDAFRSSFMPFEWRKLGRTGITLFEVRYWNDAFASLIGRGKEKAQVRFDPRNLSKIWVQVDDGRMIEARYRNLSHPEISLWESRRARKEWKEKHGGRIHEKALFDMVDAQRRLAEAARQKTKAARLGKERDARLSKAPKQRDPSREMFAIDTGNPDLPTYPIDEFHDPKRKN